MGKHHGIESWACGRNGAHCGACSLKGVLMLGLAIAAGYWAWTHWGPPDNRPTEQISGDPAALKASPQRPQGFQPGVGGENAPPLKLQSDSPLKPGAKDIVRKMFGEWERRYLSTERKQHGAASHDLSDLLVDLKKCGFYTEQALLRAIEQGLRELGIPSDQCAEVSKSMLKQAKTEGQRAKAGRETGNSKENSNSRQP